MKLIINNIRYLVVCMQRKSIMFKCMMHLKSRMNNIISIVVEVLLLNTYWIAICILRVFGCGTQSWYTTLYSTCSAGQLCRTPYLTHMKHSWTSKIFFLKFGFEEDLDFMLCWTLGTLTILRFTSEGPFFEKNPYFPKLSWIWKEIIPVILKKT